MPRVAKVMSFSATPEFVQAVDELASREGRTRSELIREALRAYADETVARETSTTWGVARAVCPAPSPPLAPAARVTAPPEPRFAGISTVLAHREAIVALCERFEVARLWVFGSAVREDFDPLSSDIDVLVEFEQGADLGPWARGLVEFEQALSSALGAGVDVVEVGAVTNDVVSASIAFERVAIYDAT